MSFSIAGLGTAVPEHRISQQDAAGLALSLCNDGKDRRRLLSTLYQRSTVRYRHSVLLESAGPGGSVWQEFYPPARDEGDRGPTTAERMERYDGAAGGLARAAACRALDDAGIPAADFTHLITVSCTGFTAPGVDMALIESLGLPPGVSRTHVGFMGCHGAMNALRTAAAFTTADPSACVLVCAVELCTLHLQYGWSTDIVVANALFADGAAAVVGVGGSSRTSTLTLRGAGSTRLAGSADFMTWRIGDHGFRMTLSAQVPDLIRERLSGWLNAWLGELGLRLEEIGSWAVHPGGPRILQACADALHLDKDQLCASRTVLEQFGNMSSPTVLFIVERLQQTAASLPWLVLGFGPGLAIEALLIDTAPGSDFRDMEFRQNTLLTSIPGV